MLDLRWTYRKRVAGMPLARYGELGTRAPLSGAEVRVNGSDVARGMPGTAGAHGTMAGYARHRQRGELACEPCAEAFRVYHRQRYAANPEAARAKSRRWLAEHRDDYNEQRRQARAECGPSAADLAYREEHRERLTVRAADFYRSAQAETKEEASHLREPWDAHELEIATRDDLSIKEAALILGRTYAAVAGARSKARRRGRWAA